MPDSEVTIKAAFLNAADVPVSFADVSADDYYYEAVLWAVSQGITLGTDDAHFSPDADCARGQLVTFLWRAAGKPKACLLYTSGRCTPRSGNAAPCRG